MSDYILADGREITFDLSQMTWGQYLKMFDPKEEEERSDQTFARVAGLTMKEVKALPFPEYKQLFAAFLKRTRDPINSPNDSRSEPTST